MSVTTIIAIYGAVLSTIAIGWNIYKSLQDKGDIQVEAMIGRVIPSDQENYILSITMTNIGKRPITIKMVGGKFKKSYKGGKKEFIIMARGLPKTLKESEFTTEWTTDYSMIGPNLKAICVWDTAGKEYKLPKCKVKNLLKEKEKL